MVEMFRLFPRESAVVMQRGIELGVACNCLLVAHCSWLAYRHWHPPAGLERILWASCLIRLVLMAPRPYFWLKTWCLFAGAGQQPTPRQVSQRLVDIYAHPFAQERCLLLSYYIWLILVAALLCVSPVSATPLAIALWRHCLASFASIVLHRVLCVSMFFFLVYAGHRQAEDARVLDNYTKRVFWSGAFIQLGFGGDVVRYGDPNFCSICLGGYSSGEQLRILRCGHYFHSGCVDTWLIKHRSCCPLCLLSVGPAASG